MGRLSALLTLFALFLMTAPTTVAQDTAEPLGDDFILFFDGPNVLIPTVNPQVVSDPLNPASDNRVAKFNYGNWSAGGFQWGRNVGVDMTANVSENAGEGDTLYVSLLVDPANAGMPGVSLTIFDKTDDSTARDGSADLHMRLQWPIPEALRDGTWHDLAIPLPPTTAAALNAAKDGMDVNGAPLATPLDDNAANWSYGGAWSLGGFGVWAPGECVDAACFAEFQWDAVQALTVFFDNSSGGGPIYLDNVYIGGPGTDVSAATAVPAPMAGVSFSTDGDENVVSWSHNPEFGGYNVYVSESAITSASLLAGEATLLTSLPFSATSFEARHSFEVPHGSLAPMPLYYAVTSKSMFGVENTDVSAASQLVENDELPVQPYILMATDDEANVIFDNVAAGVVSDAGFPDVAPFVVNQARSRAGDAPLPTDDADFSATIKVTADRLGFMYAYVDVTDDTGTFGGPTTTGGDTWNVDSFEMTLGLYDVRDVAGGSILGGSPHIAYQRGAAPDYQFRFAILADEAGNVVGTSVHSASDPNNGGGVTGEIQGGGGVGEIVTDGSGNAIGWRLLVAFPFESIIDPASDVPYVVPEGTELDLVPFNIAFNDADGGPRESQVLWTTRSSAGASWWANPSTWMTTAIAGRALATNTEEPVSAEQPFQFALEQNYPNPFNPSTTIAFSLAQAENVRVTVYNVLGQRVATLLDGKAMPAGMHAVDFQAGALPSGMYLYRLEAGSQFVQTRSMMLLK
ncbi:MAG: T9SS type A sorting domain-containing protein [Rhodothermales bacterium]